jgi:hypothetical protein
MSKNLSNILNAVNTNSLPAFGNANNILISTGTSWANSAIKTINSTTIFGTGDIATNLLGPSTSANFTRFPNALSVISNTSVSIQQNETHNIGLIAEGVANASNTSIYGIGVYGVGYTNSGTRSGGVVGEGHVSASEDAGSAIGVRGYANDTHSGGMNIGLYSDASGSSVNNYALYMNSGNITNISTQSWVLGGNLTFTGAYTVTAPTLNLTNALSVANGGTGANTANAALVALGAQATLVSNTNIKTVNGTSLLGSGDVTISSGTGIGKIIALASSLGL